MWLYHVPFSICVVSVLKITFCDKKKSLTIFYLDLLFFIKHLTIFNKKGQASLHIHACIVLMNYLIKYVYTTAMFHLYYDYQRDLWCGGETSYDSYTKLTGETPSLGQAS